MLIYDKINLTTLYYTLLTIIRGPAHEGESRNNKRTLKQ